MTKTIQPLLENGIQRIWGIHATSKMRRVDRGAFFVLSARITRLLSWVPIEEAKQKGMPADTLAQIKLFANLWV